MIIMGEQNPLRKQRGFLFDIGMLFYDLRSSN